VFVSDQVAQARKAVIAAPVRRASGSTTAPQIRPVLIRR
jgi:hypothetical protein